MVVGGIVVPLKWTGALSSVRRIGEGRACLNGSGYGRPYGWLPVGCGWMFNRCDRFLPPAGFSMGCNWLSMFWLPVGCNWLSTFDTPIAYRLLAWITW